MRRVKNTLRDWLLRVVIIMVTKVMIDING
jgi:hypothetical protein